MTEGQATKGDLLVAAAEGRFAGAEPILGAVLDAMEAQSRHAQDLLDSIHQRNKDEADIRKQRIQEILSRAPHGGPTREYEQVLNMIQWALLVDYQAVEAYRASDGNELSFQWLPPWWHDRWSAA